MPGRRDLLHAVHTGPARMFLTREPSPALGPCAVVGVGCMQVMHQNGRNRRSMDIIVRRPPSVAMPPRLSH